MDKKLLNKITDIEICMNDIQNFIQLIKDDDQSMGTTEELLSDISINASCIISVLLN